MHFPKTIFEYLDVLRAIETVALKVFRPTLPTAMVGTRQKIMDDALGLFTNIFGRFDLSDRVPSRVLEVPYADDHARLRELGAVRDGDKWTVPEHLDLSDFEPWWPLIPEDLRDTTPRLLRTKDGKSVVSYLLPSDLAKGSDSTATSFMFAALPIISALAYLACQFSGRGWLVMLLAVPYLWAIVHGESAWTAAKVAVGLLLLPFFLAISGGALLAGFGLGSLTLGGALTLLPKFGLVAGAALAFCFLRSILSDNGAAGVIGGTFSRFLSALMWAGILAIGSWIVSLFPPVLHPAFYFLAACWYPMFYTDHNFVARAIELNEQGSRFNLDSQGPMSSTHLKAREEQSRRAFEDKSPIFDLGTAQGWLTRKHHPLAPDEGSEMRLSANDLSTHLLVFGMTGTGKTMGVMRPVAKQWVQSGAGGFLCLDGKGALPGELSKLIDIMIKPGVPFAPFQGMDAGSVAIAINSLASKDPKNAFWEDSASDLVYNTIHILEALVKHEQTMLQVSREEARKRENQISSLHLQIEKARQAGEDDTVLLATLDHAIEQQTNWAARADAERKYFWTPDGFMKMLSMVNSPRVLKGQPVAGVDMQEAADLLGYDAPAGQVAAAPRTIHPKLLQEGSLLRGQLDYALKYWPTVEGPTRSSFMAHAAGRIMALTQGEHLTDQDGRHWKSTEEGIDIEQCLYGRSVGLDLPDTKHGRAAVIVAALVKQRIYSKVKQRAERGEAEWMAEGQRPLMLMIDEAQIVVGDQEALMLPIARTLKLACVFATQSYESLEAKMGDANKSAELTNAFQSLIILSSSHRTYQFASERLGTAEMVTYKQNTVGLDYLGGVKKLAAAPINDTSHPNRSALRRIERSGAGRLVVDVRLGAGFATANTWAGHGTHRISDREITKEIAVPVTGNKEVMPVFLPEEYTGLLMTPGHAILYLKRAGVPRIDLAALHRVGPDELRA